MLEKLNMMKFVNYNALSAHANILRTLDSILMRPIGDNDHNEYGWVPVFSAVNCPMHT